MRFSLSTLFLAVTLAALACGGLAAPNHWWLRSIVTLTIALYVTATIRALELHGSDRVFAVAFSIAGSLYLLGAICGFDRVLITNYPLGIVANERGMAFPTAPVSYDRSSRSERLDALIANAQSVPFDSVPIARFFLIGHCLCSWLFALLAGWFAAVMYARRHVGQSLRD